MNIYNDMKTKEQFINEFRDEMIRHNRAMRRIRAIDILISLGWVALMLALVASLIFKLI